MRESKFRLGILLLMVGCLLFSGCTTENKVVRYLLSNEKVLSDLCALKYPIEPSYIKGETDTLIKLDTLLVKGDSIPCPELKPGQKIVKVKCPDQKVITKYIDRLRVDTVVKIDTRKLASVNFDLNEAKRLLENERIIKDRWRNAAIICFIAALIGLFIKR